MQYLRVQKHYWTITDSLLVACLPTEHLSVLPSLFVSLAHFIVYFSFLTVLTVGVWSVGATPSAHFVLL